MAKITVAGGATNAAATYPVGILPSQPAAGATVEGESPARPRRNAHKHVWVYYANQLGVDVGGLSKRQIIALVGG